MQRNVLTLVSVLVILITRTDHCITISLLFFKLAEYSRLSSTSPICPHLMSAAIGPLAAHAISSSQDPAVDSFLELNEPFNCPSDELKSNRKIGQDIIVSAEPADLT